MVMGTNPVTRPTLVLLFLCHMLTLSLCLNSLFRHTTPRFSIEREDANGHPMHEYEVIYAYRAQHSHHRVPWSVM